MLHILANIVQDVFGLLLAHVRLAFRDAWWSDQVSTHFVVYSSNLYLFKEELWETTIYKALLELSTLHIPKNRAQSRVPCSAEYSFTPNMPAWFLAQWHELLMCFQEVTFESQADFLGLFALQETLNKLKSDLLEPRVIILLLAVRISPRFLNSTMSLSLQPMQP